MRSFIIFLFIFIVSVFVGFKIAQDPGFALFSYQNWTVEMPLWFVLLSIVVLFFIGYLILRLVDSIDFSLYRWHNWLRWRRKYKSYSKTNRGLIELIEGHWQTAEHYLLEGIRQSDAPLINYLAAAKAAHEQGAYDKRDSFLRKAHDLAPQADIAIGLTQAQLQLSQGQLEQALATLGHLRTVAPKHKFVLKLLERLYIRLGDWQALLKLLPSLRKAKLVDDEYIRSFEAKIYCELLIAADHKNEGIQALQMVWNTIPKKVQAEPAVVACYVKYLLSHPAAAEELELLIRKSLRKTWSKDLVRLYGLLVTSDPVKQLARAEGWQKDHPNQAVLLLTLGRLCVRAQLWGKARTYFENSLKLEVDPETYVEYGRLLELLGEQTAAVESYRDGLLLTAASYR
ncbi:MAG: heme biosynthesis HemY N-terminal domain-containing protein [Gammaproteobacteria bacterium]|nr:heme biosynthesis HemY N-terminal domain-containing protein [Gammaproteobacteria bacterium]